jgi:hypothetical protein
MTCRRIPLVRFNPSHKLNKLFTKGAQERSLLSELLLSEFLGVFAHLLQQANNDNGHRNRQ